MIRLRKTDGSSVDVTDEGTFVELVNDMDGTVMMVFLQLQPGALLHIQPGTSDAGRYEEMFARAGVKFSKTMVVRRSE